MLHQQDPDTFSGNAHGCASSNEHSSASGNGQYRVGAALEGEQELIDCAGLGTSLSSLYVSAHNLEGWYAK